jgi:hypothetical protein
LAERSEAAPAERMTHLPPHAPVPNHKSNVKLQRGHLERNDQKKRDTMRNKEGYTSTIFYPHLVPTVSCACSLFCVTMMLQERRETRRRMKRKRDRKKEGEKERKKE